MVQRHTEVLHIHTYIYIHISVLFLHHKAFRVSAPCPGSGPGPWQWKPGALTTRPPGHSPLRWWLLLFLSLSSNAHIGISQNFYDAFMVSFILKIQRFQPCDIYQEQSLLAAGPRTYFTHYVTDDPEEARAGSPKAWIINSSNRGKTPWDTDSPSHHLQVNRGTI